MIPMYGGPLCDINIVLYIQLQPRTRPSHRTPLAWWSQDGMIIFFKASEVRPNAVPSVPAVSAFLHNLCVSTGDIYDLSQMLVTLRLRGHQALWQWGTVVLSRGTDLQLVTVPLRSLELGYCPLCCYLIKLSPSFHQYEIRLFPPIGAFSFIFEWIGTIFVFCLTSKSNNLV